MANPWRFSFVSIIDEPAADFYTIFDEFYKQTFLLYSPEITRAKEEVESSLWFMLISNNGMCFKTFGIIIPLGDFTMDDVFSYGIHVNDGVLDEQDLSADIETNPFPYIMLLNRDYVPAIRAKDELVGVCE